MRALSSLGIGFSMVSLFLLLALMAEIYYLFWWKKRFGNREIQEEIKSPARELLYFFCWKKPSSSSSTALNPQEIDESHIHSSSSKDFLIPFNGGEECVEAELMRLHSLSGPPRCLFTIKEETKEEMESENGRSRKGSGGGSLDDLLLPPETPFLTPLSSPPFFTPPLTPMDCYSRHGFNPLFESSKMEELNGRVSSSPPPKFKFLKDAEEKLYKKTITKEALKNCCSSSSLEVEEDGSFITIVIGKNRENHSSFSSPVNPLPSPPIIKPVHGKLGLFLSSKEC